MSKDKSNSPQHRNADGTFTIGHPGYKTKGKPNNATLERKAKLLQVCEALEKDYLEKDLKKMEPVDRVRLWIQINEFLTPKLQRVQAEIEIPESIEQLLTMPPEERRQRIIQLREMIAQKNEEPN